MGVLKKPEDRLVFYCGIRFRRETIRRLERALQNHNDKHTAHRKLNKTDLFRKWIDEGLDRAGV